MGEKKRSGFGLDTGEKNLKFYYFNNSILNLFFFWTWIQYWILNVMFSYMELTI